MAGTANKINRVNELNRGGGVFPIPWNTLDVVKTIPAEMKFNEIFASSRGYVSRKNSVAVCRLVAAIAIVGLMLARAVRE
jgi:hypothetical protein